MPGSEAQSRKRIRVSVERSFMWAGSAWGTMYCTKSISTAVRKGLRTTWPFSTTVRVWL